jgi:hypothetical protein
MCDITMHGIIRIISSCPQEIRHAVPIDTFSLDIWRDTQIMIFPARPVESIGSEIRMAKDRCSNRLETVFYMPLEPGAEILSRTYEYGGDRPQATLQ